MRRLPFGNWRRVVYHPLTILGVALAAGLAFSLFVVLFFTGEARHFLLYYYAPVGIPFVAFLFDRAQRRRDRDSAQWMVDSLVVCAALVRAVVMVPFISGHALFLTYAILTSRSWLARLLAIAVLVQVSYLKLFAWHDSTLWGGILLACIASVGLRRIQSVATTPQTTSD
jgi:hypothetical protein